MRGAGVWLKGWGLPGRPRLRRPRAPRALRAEGPALGPCSQLRGGAGRAGPDGAAASAVVTGSSGRAEGNPRVPAVATAETERSGGGRARGAASLVCDPRCLPGAEASVVIPSPGGPVLGAEAELVFSFVIPDGSGSAGGAAGASSPLGEVA